MIMENVSIKTFLKGKKEEKEQMKILLADNSKQFSESTMSILKTIGATNSNTYDKYLNMKNSLQKLEKTLEEKRTEVEIQNYIDKKLSLISYKELTSYCEQEDLFFGKMNLYTGNIPPRIITELKNLQLNRFDNYDIIDAETSIVESKTTGHAVFYIIASPHLFRRKNTVVFHKEIYKRSTINLFKRQYPHSENKWKIIAVPLKIKGEIFFTIITNFK